MAEPETFICPECHVGHLSYTLTSYVHQYAGTMIAVPNTPAWKCDICHSCHFDPMAVQHIETLIQQAGPPPNHYKPSALPNRPPRRAEKVTDSRAQNVQAKPRPKSK